MAVDGLLAVGGILSLALGISGILLIRTQKQEVIWNKHYAAQLLCWSFVCKGLPTAFVRLVMRLNPGVLSCTRGILRTKFSLVQS